VFLCLCILFLTFSFLFFLFIFSPVKENNQESDLLSSSQLLSPFSKTIVEFSLASEEDYQKNPQNFSQPTTIRMTLSKNNMEEIPLTPGIATTPTLNPNRSPDMLTSEIFELICSQLKFIIGVAHKALIQNTMQTMINSSKSTETLDRPDEIYESLWWNTNGSGGGGGNEGDENNNGDTESGDRGGGRRGRSPGRVLRANSSEPRKNTNSLSKLRQNSPAAASTPKDSDNNNASGDQQQQSSDLVPDGIAAMNSGNNKKSNSLFTERRSRSTSTKRTSINTLMKGMNHSISREKLRSRGGGGAGGSNQELLVLASSNLKQQQQTVDESLSTARDEFLEKQFETLKSIPPDLYYRIAQHRLPIHGIWMTPSPLSIQPQFLEDMLLVVSENNTLSDNKKLEWELDLMREYDEKKMDRLERYLISKRNQALNQSASLYQNVKNKNRNSKGGKGGGLHPNFFSGNKNSSNEQYYKDRGRQPIHSIN
jgi:hypothetical protein